MEERSVRFLIVVAGAVSALQGLLICILVAAMLRPDLVVGLLFPI